MLATPNWQESNERNLHACQRSEREPGAVTDIQAWAEATHRKEYENVKRYQVSDENISTPSRNHVSVE